MSIDTPPPVSHGDFASINAAADLIRSIDSAFAELSSNAVSAAKEVEDARKNARVASEIARLFSVKSSASPTSVSSNVEVHNLMEKFPVFGNFSQTYETVTKEQIIPQPPPPPSGLDGKSINLFERASPCNEILLIDDGTTAMSGFSRRRPFDLSASDRLVKAHAQDVLSVELELEKTKQALEKEQMSHDETKSFLIQAKTKNTQVEAQIEKILSDMETKRENDARKIDQLQQELERAQFRVSAAEEDAQLALDLARENSESREQLEMWLQRALEEVQTLREHVLIMSSEHNNHPNASTVADHASGLNVSPGQYSDIGQEQNNFPSNASTQTRIMVSAGQDLFRRSVYNIENVNSPVRTVDESINATTKMSRHLRDRLRSFGMGEPECLPFATDTANVFNSKHSSKHDLGSAVDALDVCHNTAEILKKSGKKLQLTGRWWTGQSNAPFDELHLESLASHFCTAVQVSLKDSASRLLKNG